MRVAVLRCRALPRFVTWEIPDLDALFDDDRRLVAELGRLGAVAEPVAWDDPRLADGAFDLAVLRSTWDYIDDREAFLAALGRAEASSCMLLNPLDAVSWNSEKSYLLDLADRQVPVVPTRLASSAEPGALQAWLLDEGWDGAVLKPRVGAGAAGVRRLATRDLAAALALPGTGPLDELLVQPLVGSVTSEGEWSFIVLGGELSHVLLKRPAAGDFRAHGIYGGTIERVEPRAEDLDAVRAVLAALPFDLLYARLDLVRIAGRLAVMELELVEPLLYLALAPEGAGRLARAAVERARAARR